MLSRLLNRSKPKGLTCLALEPEGFGLAHVTRDDAAQPQLQVCDYRKYELGEEPHEAISAAVNQYGLRGTHCVTVLQPPAYSLRLVDAPDVGPEFLKEAARYSIADLIDFDVDEAVIDVIEIPDGQEPGAGHSIYVVAARATDTATTTDLVEDSGLYPAVIDVAEMALRNVSMLLPENADGMALMQLRAEGGMVTLCRDGSLFLARNIEMGLEQLMDASPSPADPLLEKPEPSAEAAELFEALLLEVQRSLDYYEHQIRQPRANNLWIMPLPAEIPGLLKYLSENLSVNVRELNLSEALQCEHEIARDLQARAVLAIGGALRMETLG